jgi:hypothetical protein
MKPVRASALADAVPLDGRGHRTPATRLMQDERDHYLREAARLHCIGMSDRQAAATLQVRLARYREGAWRRDSSEALMPPRLAGRLDGLLWCVLKVRDRLVGERLIRAVLAQR